MQMPSMRQQLLIDRDRGLALGAFLDKVVRDASAKRNVPKLVGATLGTSLQDIDVDVLLRAIERSGSTGESFDRPGAWSDLGQEAEDRRRLKRRELYPDAYLAEQKRQDEARASAIPGRDPGLIDEFRRMGGQMETPVGPALPGGPGMMTPVGPVERRAAEAMPEQKTGPVFRGVRPDLLRHLQSIRVPQATAIEGTDYRLGGAQDTGNIYRQVPYRTEGNWRRGGVELPFRTARERITEEELLEELGEERARQIREQDAFPDAVVRQLVAERPEPPQRPTVFAPGEQETLKRQGVSESLQTIDPSAFVADQQRGMDPQLAGVDLEGMAPESPSFLSRLGSGIKDNPEVALQIAALLGGVGSGLMGRGRLAKQQAEQDAANRQAAAYANAISTLTRGRTTPAIAPRQVRSTPGTAETIMDVLGTLGQGGAQIAAAHRQHGQAEEDRQRAQAMEDFKMQYMTRGQDIEQRGQDMDLMGQMLRASGGGGAGGAGGAAAPGANEIDVLDQVIDVAEQLYEGAPTGPVMGMFGTSPYSQYLESGQAASQYDGYRNIIKGQIAKLIGGSRPSDLDMQLADQIVPTRRDLSAPQKFNLLRQLNQFRRGQGMEGNIGHMIDPGGLTFAAGQTDMSMNLQALSDAQLYQYAQQNRNDPAVEAELNRRLGN